MQSRKPTFFRGLHRFYVENSLRISSNIYKNCNKNEKSDCQSHKNRFHCQNPSMEHLNCNDYIRSLSTNAGRIKQNDLLIYRPKVDVPSFANSFEYYKLTKNARQICRITIYSVPFRPKFLITHISYIVPSFAFQRKKKRRRKKKSQLFDDDQ